MKILNFNKKVMIIIKQDKGIDSTHLNLSFTIKGIAVSFLLPTVGYILGNVGWILDVLSLL